MPLIRGMQHYRYLHAYSREELEDRFVRLQEENLRLKENANKKDDEMKTLGTKLRKMANDQSHLAQIITGRGQLGLVDKQMNIAVEDLQQKVQRLQRQNEELKQREHIARQQHCLNNGRSLVYSGHKKLQNNNFSCYPKAPKNVKRLGGGGKYPPSLLEEARAEICSLKEKNLLQQSHIKEMEGALERLQDKLKEKEAEYEKKVMQIQQEETSKIWSNVENNVTMTKLQKQMTDKSNIVAELQERLLQLQESRSTLKESYQTAVRQMNDLLAQLNDEKKRSSQLEKQLQVPIMDNDRVQGLQQQLTQLKEERDLLRERVSNLQKSTCAACKAQKLQLQEQQLQVTQLQTALKAELVDKKAILNKIKSEEETNEELTAEIRKLKIECQEKQQKLEELNSHLSCYTEEGEYSADELNEALQLVKKQKNPTELQTAGIVEMEDRAKAMQEVKDAHDKTMQALQKSKNILSVERINCKDYKLKLEDVTRRRNKDHARYEQKLKQQEKLLDAREAKINQLETQIRQFGSTTHTVQSEDNRERSSCEESVHLECGENLTELQIVGVRLSPSALKLLDECEPTTFCTYSFFRFDNHITPVVRGQNPKYSFTSKYIVKMDDDFLEYISSCSVLVELHQRLVGCDWRTVAAAHLPLQPLFEHDGKVQGSVPLVGVSDEAPAFGSLDYCIKLKLPVTEESSEQSSTVSA
ncbi:protein fantom-like [Takifugu flavidus]|uniref:Protein fantom n=1 Tax=Takifugu flavidus TaxID=433684 RepID=A0A5C6NAP8_9TELE|nr:protein fantom-like [Takifugu flavidus]TWW64183.1 Protein fantom [Takifugu flavidus]